MREVTQDETVGGPNDGVHLVAALTISIISGWLQLPDWISLTFVSIYFAINFIWSDKKFRDKKEGMKLVKYGGILLILWIFQKLF